MKDSHEINHNIEQKAFALTQLTSNYSVIVTVIIVEPFDGVYEGQRHRFLDTIRRNSHGYTRSLRRRAFYLFATQNLVRQSSRSKTCSSRVVSHFLLY